MLGNLSFAETLQKSWVYELKKESQRGCMQEKVIWLKWRRGIWDVTSEERILREY